MADRPDSIPCPKCGKPMLRNFNYNGFVLKGDGWFKVEQGTYKGHDPKESKKNRRVKI